MVLCVSNQNKFRIVYLEGRPHINLHLKLCLMDVVSARAFKCAVQSKNTTVNQGENAVQSESQKYHQSKISCGILLVFRRRLLRNAPKCMECTVPVSSNMPGWARGLTAGVARSYEKKAITGAAHWILTRSRQRWGEVQRLKS